MERVSDVRRGRSRRMRRPVGERSMAERRRLMKNGWAVVSPKVAMRSRDEVRELVIDELGIVLNTSSSRIEIGHYAGSYG
jgi:hypothetical protein